MVYGSFTTHPSMTDSSDALPRAIVNEGSGRYALRDLLAADFLPERSKLTA